MLKPDADLPKVLYIVGWSRSGSTLLANALGSLPGFVSVGELRYLWQFTSDSRQRCGCGVVLKECPYWSQALDCFSDNSQVSLDDIHELRQKTVRVRHTLRLLRSSPERLNSLASEYLKATTTLYNCIDTLSDSRVIVDSSKFPSDAALLALAKGIDLYLLHLIRDPRAVAFSWRRQKLRGDRTSKEFMPRYGPVYSTVNWITFNVAAELISNRVVGGKALRIRYEDLTAHPKLVLEEVLEHVGHSDSLGLKDNQIEMAVSHTVNGNPSRLQSGLLTIQEDSEWLLQQDWIDRLLVTLMAAPLLNRYGYHARPTERSDASRPGGSHEAS